MTILRNGFENQTNGATVTAANSAVSGSPFTSDPTGVVTYSNAFPAHRTLGLHFAGSGAAAIAENTNLSGTNWRESFYLYLPVVGVSWQVYQCRSLISGSTAAAFGITLSSAGKLQATDSTGAVIAGTLATTALAASTLYRIEIQAVCSATVGNVNFQYFAADSTSAIQSLTPTTPNTVNTRGGTFTTRRYGRISTAGPADIYIDSCQTGDDSVTPLGPWKAPTAAFTSTPTGLSVAFNATTSTPTSPNTLTGYAWNYGDTNTDTGSTPTHVYASPGTYTVTLTVTDNTGLTDVVTHTVTVSSTLATVLPTSIVAATFTPSTGTLLSCLADPDPATLITSGTVPTSVTVTATYGALLAPLAGQGLSAMLLADTLTATSGTVTAQLYEGATLRSTVSNLPIPAGTGGSVVQPPMMFDFPSSDMGAIGSYAALKVTFTVSATGTGSTVRIATTLLMSPQAVYYWNGVSWSTTPPALALTLTVTPQPANWPPRVMIELDNVTAPSVQITRLDPDGHTVPIRNADPAATTSGLIIVYDYDPHYNQPTTYQAAGLTSPPVTLTVTQPWLIHPGLPSLSQPVLVAASNNETLHSPAGVHDITGRQYPIVVTDGRRKAPTYQLILKTELATDETGLTTLFYDASPLLFQNVQPFTTASQYRWIAVLDIDKAPRNPSNLADTARIWTCNIVDIDRPAGQVQAQRTWATLLAECPTWADVSAKYRTWRGVLTGDAGT